MFNQTQFVHLSHAKGVTRRTSCRAAARPAAFLTEQCVMKIIFIMGCLGLALVSTPRKDPKRYQSKIPRGKQANIPTFPMTFIWVARIWIWIKMRMVPEPQLANHRQCSSCSGLWHVHTDFIRLSIQRSVWSFKCLVLYKEARMYCRHRRTAIRWDQYPGQTSKPWSTWPGLAWTSLNSEPLKLYSEGYEYEKKQGQRGGSGPPPLSWWWSSRNICRADDAENISPNSLHWARAS